MSTIIQPVVRGPAISTDSVPVLFDGASGNLVKNSTPTGTGNPVLQTSPTLITPDLGTPSAIDLTNATGVAPGVDVGTAAALTTPRTINGVSFDGTANITIPGGSGTVTSVSVTTANGVSGSVANPTTTPAITLTLGAITPSSVASTGTVTGTNLSGTNTGDQTSVTGNAGTATALQTARDINGVSFDGTADITITADAGTLTGATLAANVLASSLTSVGTLAALTVTAPITGSVSGNAGTATALQTARDINGVSFDGTADITITADAGTLTGATLAPNVLASSLTSVGTLAALTVTATITGSISGNAATVTTNANLTGPITSVGNVTSVAAQTGTGSVFVMNTSPTLITPVLGVATGTSLALSAATSLTLGTSSSLTGSIVFLNSTNANTLTLKSGATSASYTLTLPTAVGAAGTVLTDVAGNGVLSWAAGGGGGFAWGTTANGTTDAGLTLTLDNSSNDGAAALKLVAGNTQANQPVLANLQIGTSGNVQGLMIQGTGSSAQGGAVGTGRNHLTLWGNTASNTNIVLEVGNGTGYLETFSMQADGQITSKYSGTTALFSIQPSALTADVFNIQLGNSLTLGDVFDISMTQSPGQWNGGVIKAILSNTNSSLTARTVSPINIDVSRTSTRTSGTTADNYNFANFKRTSIQNGAGGTFTAAGTVGNFENVATQTAGTLTDTVVVAKFTQAAISTGAILETYLGATKHFYVTTAGLPGWITADTQTTVGALGAASALPAVPTGYTKIDVNGTTFVQPYYAAA